jgi:FkbM family methyltransferase
MITKVAQSIKKHGFQEFLKRAGGYSTWFWHRHVLRAPVMTKSVYDYRMRLDLDDPGISTTLAKGILREKDQVHVLLRELKRGDTVLDVGANIGYYALLEAGRVGPGGRVYAVEPVPRNYELLRENVDLNGYGSIIQTHHLAISNENKTEKFYISAHSNLGSFYNKDYATGQRLSYMKDDYILVETRDIAEFVKDKGPIHIIRMDIEGAEVEVLTGLLKVIDPPRFAPKILFETHRSRYHPERHDIAGPLRSLFEKGYGVKTLISNEDNVRWHDRGYKADLILRTDGVLRGLYNDMRDDDAIEIICNLGGVRAVLLAPRD